MKAEKKGLEAKKKADLIVKIDELREQIRALEGVQMPTAQGDRILAAILRNSPIAMFVIDKNHKIIHWNRAMEKLSGIPALDVIGTNSQWKIFYAQEHLTMADLIVDEAVIEIRELEEIYHSRFGKFKKSDLLEEAFEATDFFPGFGVSGKWLHFTCAAIRNLDGQIFGAIETFEDITEQVKAQELYKTVSNRSPLGIYVAQKGKLIFVNEQFKKYLGYEEKELLGMDTAQLVHPDDREKTKENCIRMLKGEKNIPYEFRAIGKDGGIRWIMETVSLIEYQGEKATLGNYLDLTDQKKAELELKNIRAVESSILDAIPIAVFGMKNRIINFANHAVEDVFGWTPDELIGQDSRKIYRSDLDYNRIANDFYPVLDKEKTFREEYPCRHKDGKDIVCMVSASRIGEQLMERSIVATYEDITEQKKAEADLKRSYERLKRSMEDTIQTIAMIVETRDPYTAGHQRAVDRLACAIAEEMGLEQEQINGIHTAAVIHDIGKIYIPAEMLSKPGHLSEIEFDIMKTHPQVSYDILKRIEFPWPVANIVYQHHERYNGTGYPRGLKNNEILIEARILAVADVVESMASHRPYRPTVGMDKAMDEIRKNRGTLYDPEVVDACLRIFSKGFKLD